MSGQLALVAGEQAVAAVWEKLPPTVQREVAVRLAWLVESPARSMQ